MTRRKISLGVAILLAAWACNDAQNSRGRGGDDENDDGPSGSGASGAGAPSSTGSGGTFSCCINGVGYACPNEAALDQCAGFDIDGCMAACSPEDFECIDACFAQWETSTPDPSACTEDASVTCESTSSGPGGGCVGQWDGAMCDVDGDCPSLNCFDSRCYANDPGNPCDVDADCSSLNCYASCCYGNDAGDPCDVDADCASLNCYQNVCQ
jgi:hypothetical protein